MSLKRKKSKSEHCAGGVVYQHNGPSCHIALVQRARHNDWSLPKGHIEAGETREQAAIREVQEETGLDVRVVAYIDEVVYFFRTRKGELIRKVVYHYLMEVSGGEPGGPNWEVSEVRMLPIEDALALLTYESDRGVVAKAIIILNQQTKITS